MRILFAFMLMLVPVLAAIGAQAVSVQGALKLLSKDEAKNIVRIEAREGDPAPERWYILIYDAAGENGLREFVVAGKEIIASRSLSQFLQNAKPEDVVGSKLVKIDSDDLVKLVQQYAEASHLAVAKINYTMLKEATNPAPVWKLSCLDESGKKIAELVVNAHNENVVSHEGFAAAPGDVKLSASPSPQAQPTVKPPIPVRPARAVKASPSPSAAAKARGGFLQKMFGGRNQSQPQQTPQ